MDRLKLIKESEHFITCLDCNFVYMPFTIDAEHNCPKCEKENE